MNKVSICPVCEKEAELSASNPYRPFCSERCRLIDLGQWINEAYSVSEPSISDNDIDLEPFQKHYTQDT